ncbi:MAG: NAD(P)H-binding protein [Burkholderiaceae bacterium]
MELKSEKPRRRPKLGAPRLLIVGCGDVGGRILARAKGRFRVIALTSTPDRVAQLRAAGALPIVANLDQPVSARIAALSSRVIHLAPPPNAGAADTRTRHLLAAIAGRADRLVYISTTGVYGDRGGAATTETTPLRPASARAIRRIDAERQLRRAGRGKLAVSVLRAPGLYAHDRLPLDRLRAGTPALAAADDVFTNHIHADDLARLALAALARGKPQRIYNAVDDSDLLMGEYFDLVADAFDLPRPPRLPRAELAHVVSPALLSFMSESRRIGNARIRRELRVRLAWPTVAATLADLRRDSNPRS